MERIYIVKIGNEVAAAFSKKLYADHFVSTYLYALKNVSVVSMPIDDEDMIGDTIPHVEDADDHEQDMSATYTPSDEAEEDNKDDDDDDSAERAFITFMRLLNELGEKE